MRDSLTRQPGRSAARGVGTTRERWLEQLAGLGFFLIFPGFFLYHIVIAVGLLPDFARGFWGVTNAGFALVGLVGLGVLPAILRRAGRPFGILLAVFLGYVALWCALSYAVQDSRYREDALLQVAGTFVSWIALAYIGAWLPWRSRRLYVWMALAMATMALIMIVFIDPGRLVFDMRKFSSYDVETTSYQGAARSVVATALFLVIMARTANGVAVAFVAALAMLFLVGARSELFGFVAVVTVYGALVLGRGSFGARVYVVIAVVAALSALVWFAGNSTLMASRQLQVLSLSEATSWIGRGELMTVALEQISNDPLAGDFTGNWELGVGEGGGYAHNVLSAWVSLGLVGFLLYAALLGIGVVVALARVVRDPAAARVWWLATAFLLLGFVLAISLKPVFWTLPALAWGLLLGAYRSDTRSVPTGRPSVAHRGSARAPTFARART